MTGATTAERTVKRRKGSEASAFDKELAHTSPAARWREWMMRVEAVIFASVEPVSRETLAQVVGSGCSIDLLIDDLREELRDRPYEIVFVAGGFPTPYESELRAGHPCCRRSDPFGRCRALPARGCGDHGRRLLPAGHTW